MTSTKALVHQATQASLEEKCPLCGKERYCFLIKNHRGEIAKAICQWTDTVNSPSEWKHIGTAKDGRPIFANLSCTTSKRRRSKKYPEIITLTPEEKILPQWQDFSVPTEDLTKGHIVRLKEGCPGGINTLYTVERIDARKKMGLGEKKPNEKSAFGVELRPVKGNGKVVVALDDVAEVVTSDPETGAKERFIEYSYSETQKVVRKQWTDRREVYRGKSKQVLPYHLVGGKQQDGALDGGEWVLGKGEQEWYLYREDEASATAQNGGIVFAAAGEQCVEGLRSLGLTATCNQGGEGGFSKIAKRLAEPFAAASEVDEADAAEGLGTPELKPLLVIWADNDPVGETNAQKLLKECYKEKVTAVVLSAQSLLSMLPEDKREKADAHDWIEFCKESGISSEEMIRNLEIAIDQSIEEEEEDAQWRWQRQAWNAPASYKGEIGFWRENDDSKRFEPSCNFDFQVERELEDAAGGGLVLQVKRSFENNQYRVILNSTDYTKVDNFVDALKREIGAGIVCNLSKPQLNALIHTRLHEYRTSRNGKLFKRIDRYGQQEDGTWVFRDRQYKPDGTPTNENESGWVFNPSLGKDDFIPYPVLAEENPQALKRLVDASREFFGEQNINQVLLTMGWTVAGLHSGSIYRQDGCYPLLNSHGEPGSCKTIAAETALSLIGKNWDQAGMLARASVSALYEHGSRTGSLPFFWDDPDRNPENEELAKSWYNWKPRKVRGNEQTPHSPMGITSNHVFGGEQAATYTRFVRIAFERAKGGNKAAFQELKAAQTMASGAFPQLLALGYPRDAIAVLETELLQYLPHAHARIAQSLAIVTWYAQKIVDLTDGTENVKQWVIDRCCQSENDSDAAGDSLVDFIEKVLALEAESLVGDWNLKRNVEREGQKFYAIYAHDVWKLVDQRFKPATYNERSLKSLVIKAGGVTDFSMRFAGDRDQVLAYYRAALTVRQTENGESIEPNQPKTTTRKAWLIPAHLFGEDVTETVTGVTECNRTPVTPLNPGQSRVLAYQNSECNHVTEKNELKQNQPDFASCKEEGSANNSFSENFGYSGYTQLHEQQTTQNQGFEPVTESQAESVTPSYSSYSQPAEQQTTQNQGFEPVTENQNTPANTSNERPVSDFDPVRNAQRMLDALQHDNAGEMLDKLLSFWNEVQQSAVLSHLQPEELEAVQKILQKYKASKQPAATDGNTLPQFQLGQHVRIIHELHPDRGHRLEVKKIKQKWLYCKYLTGKSKGKLVPFDPTEISPA